MFLEIYVPASSMLGLIARANSRTSQENPPTLELPISLPSEDKEMIDILISLAPVHHASLKNLSMEEVAVVEKNTRQQSLCGEWKNMRKF